MDDNAIETFEVEGLTVKIFQDEDPESPRAWDNLGKMICFHRRYTLGDKHELTIEEAHKIAADPANIVLPLYLIDHSGLSMRTRDFSDCDPGEWDSGQVGIIYADKDTIKKEYGKVNAETCEQARKVLQAEVETFDQHLRGDVYGYVIEGEDGEHGDSCWGFYGFEYCKEEATGAAKAHREYLMEEEGKFQLCLAL